MAQNKRERDTFHSVDDILEYLETNEDVVLYLDPTSIIPDNVKRGDIGQRGSKYKIWLVFPKDSERNNVSFTATRPNGETKYFSAKLDEHEFNYSKRIRLADVNRDSNENRWQKFTVILPEKETKSPKVAKAGPKPRIAPIARKSSTRNSPPRKREFPSETKFMKPDADPLEKEALTLALNDDALQKKAIAILVERHAPEIERQAEMTKNQLKTTLMDEYRAKLTPAEMEQIQKEAWQLAVNDTKALMLNAEAARIRTIALKQLIEEAKAMQQNFVVDPDLPVNETERNNVRDMARDLFQQKIAEIQNGN